MPLAIDIEGRALSSGDLSKLDEAERGALVETLCTRFSLDPGLPNFTFSRDVETGALRLIIRKVAIQQIRANKGISVDSATPALIGDVIVFTVGGHDFQGRREFASGAISVEGLSGADKAAAYMAAETKAQQRLTLALAGIFLPTENETTPRRPEPERPVQPAVNQEPGILIAPPEIIDTKQANEIIQRVLAAGKTIPEPGPAIGKMAAEINRQETPQTEAPAPPPKVEVGGGFDFGAEEPAQTLQFTQAPQFDHYETSAHVVVSVPVPEPPAMPSVQAATSILNEPEILTNGNARKPTNNEFKAFTARCTKLVRDVLPKAGKDVPSLLLPYLKKYGSVKDIQLLTVDQWETVLNKLETAGPQEAARMMRG